MPRRFLGRRTAAFTLAELMVVGGVIVLLIGILIPVVGRARRQGQQVVCASNLRQIGIALTAYTTENAYYPGAQYRAGTTYYAVWPLRLRHYLNDDLAVFYCPSQSDEMKWTATVGTGTGFAGDGEIGFGYKRGERLLDRSVVQFSYGYNDWGVQAAGQGAIDIRNQRGLGGDIVPGSYNPQLSEQPAARVKVPSDMIAIADSTQGDNAFVIDPVSATQNPGNIHGNGANVLFCDGHVQWFETASLIAPRILEPANFATNQMWNADDKSHLD